MPAGERRRQVQRAEFAGCVSRGHRPYRGLRERPDDVDLRLHYAYALIHERRLKDATEQIEAAVALAPDDAAVLTHVAGLRFGVGDPPGAKRCIARARALPEGLSPELETRLEFLEGRLADQRSPTIAGEPEVIDTPTPPDPAVDRLIRTVEQVASGSPAHDLALVLHDLDSDAAQEIFEQAMRSDDPALRAEATVCLGQLRSRQGDVEGARAAYAQVIRSDDEHQAPVARTLTRWLDGPGSQWSRG